MTPGDALKLLVVMGTLGHRSKLQMAGVSFKTLGGKSKAVSLPLTDS
jgi:hypothetical protein